MGTAACASAVQTRPTKVVVPHCAARQGARSQAAAAAAAVAASAALRAIQQLYPENVHPLHMQAHLHATPTPPGDQPRTTAPTCVRFPADVEVVLLQLRVEVEERLGRQGMDHQATWLSRGVCGDGDRTRYSQEPTREWDGRRSSTFATHEGGVRVFNRVGCGVVWRGAARDWLVVVRW